MPDILDKASELEEMARAASLRVRKPTLERTGFCLNKRCGEELSNFEAAFCSLSCSKEYDKIFAAR